MAEGVTAATAAIPVTAAAPRTPRATEEPPGPATVGVEEEFLFVDPASGSPVPAAADVLAAAGRETVLPCGAELKHELMASQLEVASGVCHGLGELAGQLSAGRRRLAAEAQRLGLVLLSTGVPLHTTAPARLTQGPRFEQIEDIYAGVVSDYEACGCHVHVGVPDREAAVAVVNHLRPWLPTLLALSVNSPFHQGRDTGYGSWRMVLQSRFPGAGLPPHFASAADYDEEVQRLVACGILADARQNFWLARPSERFPTVEFRVADAAASAEEAILQAALSRALVHTALGELARGREADPVRDQLAAAAVWAAARHGLSRDAVHAVHLRLERRVPALMLAQELVEYVTPALEETGELDCVRRLLARLTSAGTGAERQRAAAAGGHEALLVQLAEETVRPVGRELFPHPAPTVSRGAP